MPPDLSPIDGWRDRAIEEAVVAALENNFVVPHGRVSVSVRNRVVTLRGRVDFSYQSQAAENIVRNVSGVGAVINALEVTHR